MSNYSVSLLAYDSMRATSPERTLNARKQRARRHSASTVDADDRILECDRLSSYNTNNSAREAGISVGSLYQYFPNKNAITSAPLTRELEALNTAITSASGKEGCEAWLDRQIKGPIERRLGRPTLSRFWRPRSHAGQPGTDREAKRVDVARPGGVVGLLTETAGVKRMRVRRGFYQVHGGLGGLSW